MDVGLRFAVLLVGVALIYVLFKLQIWVAREYLAPVIEEDVVDEENQQ